MLLAHAAAGRKYKRCCYAPDSPLMEHADGSLAHVIPMDGEVRAILKRQHEKFVAFDSPFRAAVDNLVERACR
jgi:hypothetical protein